MHMLDNSFNHKRKRKLRVGCINGLELEDLIKNAPILRYKPWVDKGQRSNTFPAPKNI